MTIYGISDLHLDSSGEKPMDVFGNNWYNHEKKIFESWKQTVKEDDIVLISGDISWALKLDNAFFDLKKIDELKGKKIISKGNHDYWWESKRKLNSLDLSSIHFLYNDSYIHNGIAICGTRGWLSRDYDEFGEHDEKIYKRELNRLELSLRSVKTDVDTIIAMLHYPPFNSDGSPNDFVYLMKEYDVSSCVYGHLHDKGHKYVKEGDIEGVEFHCISSDFLKFNVKKIL